MFGAHARARHPGVTIDVDEVDISIDKDVLIIRRPRRENERGQDKNLKDDKNALKDFDAKIRNGGERTRDPTRFSDIFQMLELSFPI